MELNRPQSPFNRLANLFQSRPRTRTSSLDRNQTFLPIDTNVLNRAPTENIGGDKARLGAPAKEDSMENKMAYLESMGKLLGDFQASKDLIEKAVYFEKVTSKMQEQAKASFSVPICLLDTLGYFTHKINKELMLQNRRQGNRVGNIYSNDYRMDSRDSPMVTDIPGKDPDERCGTCSKHGHTDFNCWRNSKGPNFRPPLFKKFLGKCGTCSKYGHTDLNCWRNSKGPNFRPPPVKKFLSYCLLCNSQVHTAPSCILYKNVVPVPDECSVCMNAVGLAFYHPLKNCLNQLALSKN